MIVYVAGPYTAPTAWQRHINVESARTVGRFIVARGHVAVVPHMMSLDIGDEQPESYWYEATLALMLRCDAVVMVHGWERSTGAEAERHAAELAGLPVYFAACDLPDPSEPAPKRVIVTASVADAACDTLHLLSKVAGRVAAELRAELDRQGVQRLGGDPQ